MKNFKTLIKKSVLLLIIITTSCTSDFDEINTNPNQATENPSLDLLFSSIMPGFANQLTSSYEVTGQFAQQFAIKNSDAGVLRQDDDAISRRFWETVYSENNGALRNASFLSFEAEKRGNNDLYQAIGKIYKVYMLSYTTDLFGDIPYTQAGQAFKISNENLLPKYDSQKLVYESMLADLELANDLIANANENPNNLSISEEFDVLFNGDASKWQKFVNSLQLRLLMRISNVESTGSKIKEILENPEDYPIIESIEDEPVFSYNSLVDWSLNPANEDDFNEIRLSATVVNIMKGEGGDNKISDVQDTRLAYLLNPTTANTSEFVGQPVGLVSDTAVDAERSLLSENFRNLNKFWLITAAEIAFIKTEAAHRGFINGSAEDLYIEGVEKSLNRYGLSDNSTYLADLRTNFSGNEIKHIAIQRWMDQVNNGFEGYAVWRRMNFPVLELGQDVVASQIPTRFFYSSKTTDKNQENADIAINRAPLNGSNLITDKVWWDKE